MPLSTLPALTSWPTEAEREAIREANRREYGEAAEHLNWITPERARTATSERRALLDALGGRALTGCGGAKIDCRNLAPGCQACARGEWSCLFISGLCNAHCFFCPTSQDEAGEPMTASSVFRDPGDFADYLRVFGFTGASISGGEPLLSLPKALGFLRTIRERLGDAIHLWLYTNGTHATPEALRQLRDAGLDEIRFNITATGLDSRAAASAVGVIPTVTVEIPAVPEMESALRGTIRELHAAGIAHLNLHQLRLTSHNLPRLAARAYTFLRGASATVLESELTALRLLVWTLDEGVALPINYCSFVYRNRSAALAARTRGIAFARKPFEDTTPTGHLRQLSIEGSSGDLATLAAALRERGTGPDALRLDRSAERVQLPASLLAGMDLAPFRAAVSYHECRVVSTLSYRRLFVEVPLNAGRSFHVERAPVGPAIALTPDEADVLARHAAGDGAAAELLPPSLRTWEKPEDGFAEYW